MQRDALLDQMIELLTEVIDENRLDTDFDAGLETGLDAGLDSGPKADPQAATPGAPDTPELTPDTALFGGGAVITSLTLVSFITDIEALLDEEWDLQMTIVDERALSRKNSPFLTIATLADYILERAAEKSAAA